MAERIRLLQHGEIQPANIIPHPERLSHRQLQLWFDTAEGIATANGYSGLAFTQLPLELQHSLGFSAELPPRVFYTGRYLHDVYRQDRLWINPVYSSPEEFDPVVQGCGSVGDAQYEYGDKPPHLIQAAAYVWSPGEPHPRATHIEINSGLSVIYYHEKKHLDGKTILNDPHAMLDFREASQWSPLLLNRIVDPNKKCLFFDAATQQIMEMVFGHGDTIIPYEHQPTQEDLTGLTTGF